MQKNVDEVKVDVVPGKSISVLVTRVKARCQGVEWWDLCARAVLRSRVTVA